MSKTIDHSSSYKKTYDKGFNITLCNNNYYSQDLGGLEHFLS